MAAVQTVLCLSARILSRRWEVIVSLYTPCHSSPALTDNCSLCPQLEDCALQVSPSGYYLDPDLSLEEQREMLEGFYEEIRSEMMRPGWPHPAATRGWLRCQQPRHLISI